MAKLSVIFVLNVKKEETRRMQALLEGILFCCAFIIYYSPICHSMSFSM